MAIWWRRREWCCPAFEARFSRAGERGVSIFVDDAAHPPRFILQHRFPGRGRSLSKSNGGALSVTTDTVIRFCPYCGVNLDRWYRGSLRRLARPDLAVRTGGPAAPVPNAPGPG